MKRVVETRIGKVLDSSVGLGVDRVLDAGVVVLVDCGATGVLGEYALEALSERANWGSSKVFFSPVKHSFV